MYETVSGSDGKKEEAEKNKRYFDSNYYSSDRTICIKS